MKGLDPARAAAGEGAWQRVLDALPATNGLSDEALQLRASALYATGDLEACLASWQELHARHAASGNRADAAQAAAMTAMFLLIDTGLMAPVRGWMARAESALGDLLAGAVRATIAMVRTYERLLSGDMDGCRREAAAAVQLGSQHNNVAAVVIGQVAQARILVLDGNVDAGLRALNRRAPG